MLAASVIGLFLIPSGSYFVESSSKKKEAAPPDATPSPSEVLKASAGPPPTE